MNNGDQSLIEVAFEGHSRLQSSILDLQNQLCLLENLRNSSELSVAKLKWPDLSPANCELQTDICGFKEPVLQSTLKQDKLNTSDRMHAKELDLPDFDLTAVLSNLSISDGSNNGTNNDELISLLERISAAGKDLQVELKDARYRESNLRSEIKNLQSRLNYSFTNGHTDGSSTHNDLALKCEKLQDAMLSLQDENIRLNRLLKSQQNGFNSSQNIAIKTVSAATSPMSSFYKDENMSQQKLEQMQAVIDHLTTLQKSTEEKYKNEKNRNEILEGKIELFKQNVKSEAQEFESLDEKNRKLMLIEMERDQYKKRIENLEWQLNLHQKSSVGEQSYLSRIDDLNKLLTHKENEIHEVKGQLRKMEENMLIQKATKSQKNGEDITKRREVLLLCEKYETLRKNQKRLEEDLRTTQTELQSEHTKKWALEMSVQQLNVENQKLKKNHANVKKLKQELLENASLIRDYEKLTQKYESLLSLRLQEYGRLKKMKKRKHVQDGGWSNASTPRNHYQEDDEPQIRKNGATHSLKPGTNPIYDPQACPTEPYDVTNRLYTNGEQRMRSKSVDSIHNAPTLYNLQRPVNHGQNFPTSAHINMNEPLQTYPQISEATKVDLGSVPQGRLTNVIPSPKYKSKFAREKLANKVVETSRHDINACGDFMKYDNILTSTPDKSKYGVPSIKMYVRKDNEFEKWLPDHISVKKYDIGPRARSCSPMRNNEEFHTDLHAPVSSRVSRKVSFEIPRHQRSQSASTPVKNAPNFLKNLRTSPPEIQQRVQKAYEDEYIKNMKGTMYKTEKTKKIETLKSLENKSPFSEEYLKLMDEINELKKNKINISLRSSISSKTTLTQSDDSIKDSENSACEKSIGSEIGQKFHAATNTDKKEEKSDTKGRNSDETRPANDLIIDIVPVCHNNESSDSMVNIESAETKTSTPRKGILKKSKFEIKSEDVLVHKEKNDDLTIPYQLQNVDKDYDTDSSISTTRDHIGRYEFLQDMESSKKRTSNNFNEDIHQNEKEDSRDLTPTGLSARQQEYADKLVKKYQKMNQH